jgi:hypothetical protein
LLDLKDRSVQEPHQLLTDAGGWFTLLLYLLLIFGASASWPLLIPPLVLVLVLLLVPDDLNIIILARQLWRPQSIPLVLAFALQLVPIYFQLKYSGADASQGINLTGGLKQFHALVLLAGIVIALASLLGGRLNHAYKRLLLALFVPFVLFIGLLVLMQYFKVGEIRYYVIKSSLLLEMLLLAFAVAAFVRLILRSEFGAITKFAIFAPVIPLTVMLLLVSVLDNPLKSVRDLFRDYSHQEKPAFFDQDVRTYTRLGSEGKIKHFNSTLLHYNAGQHKFFAHMQLPFWSNMMQYDASQQDFDTLNHCSGLLYTNLAFGSFTDKEQQDLVSIIKTCAAAAKSHGEQYYIVTDHDSAPMIHSTFSDLVNTTY